MAKSTIATQKEPISKMGYLVAFTVFIGMLCDGMDLQMLSLSLPLLKSEFGLTSVAAGALSSWTLFGMLCGGLVAGPLADRIGRSKVVAYGLIVFSVFTASLAFTHSFWPFAIIRFISGFGLTAVYSIGVMFTSEFIPTSRRATVLGILQAGWSVGYIVAALLATAIQPKFGWRPMFAIAIIPAFLSILVFRYIKEPDSFKAALAEKEKSGKKENEYAVLWRDKSIRKNWLIWTTAAIFILFGYYGANTWLPSYLVKDLGIDLNNMGWYVAGTYSCMVIGKVFSGWLADKIGRRAMWTIAGVTTSFAMPLIIHYANASNVAILLLVFGLLYGSSFAVAHSYLNESFPTKIRGTAVSSAWNVGRIGSVISPMLVGVVAAQYSIGLGIALLGGAYFIATLLPAFFIAEKQYDPKKGEIELVESNN